MKRILIIITISLLSLNNVFASELNNQNQFNKWLLENGHSQYLKDGGAQVDICATFKKNSDAWLNEECGNYPKGKMITLNNLKIKLANKAFSSTKGPLAVLIRQAPFFIQDNFSWSKKLIFDLVFGMCKLIQSDASTIDLRSEILF